MDEDKWMEEVVSLAKQFGYSDRQIMAFSMDIVECYDEGLSPEECVAKVF